MENKEVKMIKVNAWIGVENLEEIEATLEDKPYKYSMTLEALTGACKKNGLEIVSQQIAVNQSYKSISALIEVHGDGEYNPVLAFQMNWNSPNVKTRWGCHFKEEDVYAFPVSQLKGANPFLNGVTAIVDDNDKWLLKIEETFAYLNKIVVTKKEVWSEYMYLIALDLDALPSSQITQTMKEWDESGEKSLYSFYMVLCQKLSKKEPNALFTYSEKLLKSKCFTPESPIKGLTQSERDELDYDPIDSQPVDEASWEAEYIAQQENKDEDQDEGVLIASKYY
jgi:hypothetical protein